MKKKKDVKFESAKFCIPTSSGGHLTHMKMIESIWKDNDRFYVTFNKADANSALSGERMYYCHFPTNRNIWNLMRNTFLAFKILHKEKPDIIVSSGAAIAIPFFFLGKLFFRCKCVYVEVFDRIDKSTMAGKFCYKFADLFIVQWEEQLKVYPKAICLGSIF